MNRHYKVKIDHNLEECAKYISLSGKSPAIVNITKIVYVTSM